VKDIYGLVTDETNTPVSFASVFVKDMNVSTMANENGYFKLSIKPGKYTLIFRFVGYKSLEREIELIESVREDVVLLKDSYTLDEVHITEKKEDPANAVIRNIISKRKYLRSTPSYECDVYTKGVQKLMDAPKRILGENVGKTLNL